MTSTEAILITGASRDLGARLACQLALPGRLIIIHSHAAVEADAPVLASVRARGAEALALPADLSEPAQWEPFVAKLRAALGGLKLVALIHNAAIAVPTPVAAPQTQALRAVLCVNVEAPQFLTLSLADELAEGASIVSITVADNAVFSPEFAGFTASKAALQSLTRHWAVAFGPRGIRANCVAPGVFAANFRAELLADEGFRTQLEAATVLRRVGQVDDVADAVSLLLDDRSRWITGQTVQASGGWRLSWA